MVSHVDSDHIVGIKKLFGELKSEIEDETSERRADIQGRTRLWHNTFNDILGDGIERLLQDLHGKLTASVERRTGRGSGRQGSKEKLKEKGESKNDEEAAHVAYDIGLVLAGHGEARELRDSHNFMLRKQGIAALNHAVQERRQADANHRRR